MDSTERIKPEKVAGFVETTLFMIEGARWTVQNALSWKKWQAESRPHY
jgi:hypothetical protein